MRATLTLTAFLLFAAWLGALDYYEAQEDFTDTGVGCLDDCFELESADQQPEPPKTWI